MFRNNLKQKKMPSNKACGQSKSKKKDIGSAQGQHGPWMDLNLLNFKFKYV